MESFLFDTSVLIAGFVATHPKHRQAATWLKRAINQEIEWFVSAHSIAECYAVLTRLPLFPKISPSVAKNLLEENILSHAQIVSLSTQEYISVINHLSALGLSGGIIYDAIIFKAAKKAKVKKILTLNPRDFDRLSNERTDYIFSP